MENLQKRKYHFIYIGFSLKFKNYHVGNLNETYLVNICFPNVQGMYGFFTWFCIFCAPGSEGVHQ